MYLAQDPIGRNLVRSPINIDANSNQIINVQYITPLNGKIKLLIFPSASITASLSLTDMVTNQTFTVDVNSGNPVYGEYVMDISKLIQINSITLTNNNSSPVSGYVILIYEVS